jgi:LPXTG-site transpeptidase (sortase) family protein
MSLEMKRTSARKVFRYFLVVLVLVFIGCLTKVAVWEYFYYNNETNITRTKPENLAATPEQIAFSEPEEDYDESEPTQSAISDHKVSPDKPRYISIPRLGIKNAKIIEIGIQKNGKLGVPNNIFDVGWYRDSSKPGEGGTLLMDGHNGGPTKDGIFKRLDSLSRGDIIKIERGDGKVFTYEVYENEIVSIEEADAHMKYMTRSPIAGKESLSLITCTGGWSQIRNTMDHRAMLRAILVSEE